MDFWGATWGKAENTADTNLLEIGEICSWGNCNSKYGDPSYFCFEVGFCQGLCSGPGFGQSGAVPVSPAPGATERKKMRNRRWGRKVIESTDVDEWEKKKRIKIKWKREKKKKKKKVNSKALKAKFSEFFLRPRSDSSAPSIYPFCSWAASWLHPPSTFASTFFGLTSPTPQKGPPTSPSISKKIQIQIN